MSRRNISRGVQGAALTRRLSVLSVLTGLALVWAAPVAPADSCPNATFRVGPSESLPDCRAYELVSPPFKNGQLPFASPFVDASHFVFSSLGAFGSPDNATANGANYIAARGPGGWGAIPIDSSALEFENAGEINLQLQDVSQTFDAALFAKVPASSTPVDVHLYKHEPAGIGATCPAGATRSADACVVEVGPAIPPAATASWTPNEGSPLVIYAGASRDLAHVMFRSRPQEGRPTNFLWPGDTTLAFTSLYEYEGQAHGGEPREPKLVGVSNNGALHSNGEATLISQCGIYLGGITATAGISSEEAYNAISESGETVFFTARQGGCEGQGKTGLGPPANEVYARLGHAKTVPISEPTKADCASCNTAAPANAVFQGAASDGSTAFFLSEQPLLPGAEAQSLFEYDFSAGPGAKVSLVAPKVLGVARVSRQGTHVYFVAESVLAANEGSKGQTAKAGQNNLYLFERDARYPGGRTTFITALAAEDSEDWAAVDGRPVEATPDGRFLLLESTNDLTPDASGTGRQLYRYDAQTGELVRVSIGEGGFNDNHGQFFTIRAPELSATVQAAPAGVSISEDGAYVFFQSASGLTPQAPNNVALPGGEFAQNVYEYHGGHVYLLSGGGQPHETLGGGSDVGLLGAAESGHDVYFTTADSLLPEDKDTQVDIYDARVGGGFQSAAATAGCGGEACLGPSSGAPSLLSPGSTTLAGAGDAAPPVTASGGPPRHASLTTAQRRALALRACQRKRAKRQRLACVRQVMARYRSSSTARRHLRHWRKR
jgi:hypothetical protein